MLDSPTPTDHPDAALAERVRIFLFSLDRPVSRLALDVEGIEAYVLIDDDTSPHLRLVRDMPALTPPASAIVASIVRRPTK